MYMEPGLNDSLQMNTFVQFRKGLAQGLPIFLGYIPAAVAFGVLGAATGLSVYETSAMSVCVFAGASQFMALNLIQNGVNVPEIIFATFVLNLRHLLMSTVLTQRIKGNWLVKSILAFGITDETFVLSTISNNRAKDEGSLNKGIDTARFAGMALVAYSGWVAGTLLGVLFVNILPQAVMKGMGISLYAMFIALLVPSLKRSRKIALVAVLGAVINWVLLAVVKISGGWSIVTATVVASAIGALVYKGGTD